MKKLLLTLALVSSQVYAHGHHHPVHVNGTIDSVAGWSSLLWNGLELSFHGAELAGFKPTIKPPCSGCPKRASHALKAILPSKFEKAYHIIELSTHGLNLFDTSAKMSDTVSDTIEEYISPIVLSSTTLAANLGVIAYRLYDSRQLLKVVRSELAESTRLQAVAFILWGLIDACGHISSVYMAMPARGPEEGLPEL